MNITVDCILLSIIVEQCLTFLVGLIGTECLVIRSEAYRASFLGSKLSGMGDTPTCSSASSGQSLGLIWAGLNAMKTHTQWSAREYYAQKKDPGNKLKETVCAQE